jgi:hypothetical protein
MILSDVWLLTKKILIGIAVTVVPLAIIAGSLWMTQSFLGKHKQSKQTSSVKVIYADRA